MARCTYKQAADYIRIPCPFGSQEEKNLILGGNAARIVFLPEQVLTDHGGHLETIENAQPITASPHAFAPSSMPV